MVVFNELRINDANDTLIIDCAVEDLPIYEHMYIKSIDLYYYKNADSSGEPVDLTKVLTVVDNDQDDTTVRTVRKCVLAPAAEAVLKANCFEKGIFFVKVTCDGTLGSDASQYACGFDDVTDIGVAVDWRYLFDAGMNFVASLDICDNMCKSNAGFEQFILTWFSLRLALEACDFDKLGGLWERFLKITAVSSLSHVSGCGCQNR